MPGALTSPVLAEITGLGKTVLLLVAGTFILWALYTAMVVPRRDADFPRNLAAYILVTVVLFASQLSAVVWVTGTQEVEKEVAGETTGGEETTPPATTGGDQTTPPATTGGEETAGGGAQGDPAAGKQVFASAGCGGCHTLADAGTSGTIGPSLDQSKPSFELVVDRVTNGKGVMPPFKGQLTDAQIDAVAEYVGSVAGK